MKTAGRAVWCCLPMPISAGCKVDMLVASLCVEYGSYLSIDYCSIHLNPNQGRTVDVPNFDEKP